VKIAKSELVALGLISHSLGLIALAISGFYFLRYLFGEPGTLHNELMIGSGIGFMWAVCAFLVSSAVAFIGRRIIGKFWLLVFFLPGLTTCAIYIGFLSLAWF
jgi:hypothetical protein